MRRGYSRFPQSDDSRGPWQTLSSTVPEPGASSRRAAFGQTSRGRLQWGLVALHSSHAPPPLPRPGSSATHTASYASPAPQEPSPGYPAWQPASGLALPHAGLPCLTAGQLTTASFLRLSPSVGLTRGQGPSTVPRPSQYSGGLPPRPHLR